MFRRPPTRRMKVIVSIGLVALTLLISLSLAQHITYGRVFLFTAAVFAAAWYGGLRAGLLATTLSVGSIAYVTVSQAGSIRLDDALILALFAFAGVVMSWSQGRQQAAVKTAQVGEKRFEIVAQALRGLIYDYDLVTNAVYRSDGLYDVIGLYPGETELTGDWWTARIHPDDLAQANDNYVRATAARQPYFQSEYRIRHKDGSYVWVWDNGHVTYDPKGQPVRIIGCTLNIDDRKRTEQALSEEEQKARRRLSEIEAIYDNAPVGLCLLDTQLHYVRINQVLADINGVPPAAHIGRTVREVIPDLADSLEPEFQQIIATGEPVFGREITGETPASPGVRRTWVENWMPLKNQQGKIVGLNVVAEEVTTRKAMEKRLAILHQMASAFSAALTPSDVVRHLLENCLTPLGATGASVAVLSADDTELELIQSIGYPTPTQHYWQRFPIASPTAPLSVAVRTRTPLWFGSPEERLQQVPFTPNAPLDDTHQAWAVLPMMIGDRVIGDLGLSFPTVKNFDEAERDFMLALAQQCAQAIERAQLYQAEQVARQSAEHTADQVARLQSLTEALSESVSLDQVAEVMIQQSVLAVGATSGVFNFYHADTQEIEIVSSMNFHETLVYRYRRATIFAPGASPRAAQTRQPVWFHSRAEYLHAFPELPDVPEKQQSEAVAALPLLYQGRLLGILGLYFAEEREFLADERDFLLTIARQCAIALERAQLYAAEQTARQRAEQTATWLARLQFVTASLSQAIAAYDVTKIIVDSGMTVLGAENGAIVLVTAEKRFEVIYAAGVETSPHGVDRWQRFLTEPGQPGADALSLGQALWFESREARDREFPILASLSEAYPGAWALLPLGARGEIVGAAGFTFAHDRTFAPEEKEFMLTLAHYCTQALERARLYEAIKAIGAEEERKRLARELHDAVTQTLFSSSLMAESLTALIDRDIDLTKKRIDQLVQLNRAALAEMRTLLLELRPEQVLRTPMRDLLIQLTQAVQGRKLIDISLTIEGSQPLPPDVHVAFYRVAQEILNNIVKHSQATQGQVFFKSTPEEAELRVRDNGIGFDIANDQSGFGLETMKERSLAQGATIQIVSQIGQGTEIILRWQPTPQATVSTP